MTFCGIVSIIGKPNAGKSTLLNALVGEKISIVTYKAQTTRSQVRGITIWDDTQVIFLDTPGIFSAKKEFDKALVKNAMKSIHDVDYVLVIIDSVKPDLEFIDSIIKKDNLIVINKIDHPKSQKNEIKNHYKDYDVCEISALNNTNLDILKEKIKSKMPKGPFLYEKNQITNLSKKMLVAEITREKVILFLKQELPYEIYVETTGYKVKENGDILINQDIVVSHDRYKSIVLGKKGGMIKKIGTSARIDISNNLKKTVHLFLNVKVSSKWQEKITYLQKIGII